MLSLAQERTVAQNKTLKKYCKITAMLEWQITKHGNCGIVKDYYFYSENKIFPKYQQDSENKNLLQGFHNFSFHATVQNQIYTDYSFSVLWLKKH